MRKEIKDGKLWFYDVELWKTPFEYSECLHIEDPDITENHFLPLMRLPNQESNILWETHNGVLKMFGKIKHPSYINFYLYTNDVIEK